MYDRLGRESGTLDFTVYGKEWGKGFRGWMGCPFRYLGQYADAETGLYYNRFRYYDLEAGQYISQDPIGLAGGNPTLYGYVGDTNGQTDVLGLACNAPNPSLKRTLPSHKKIEVDLDHIVSGHTKGGSRTGGGLKDLFPEYMSDEAVGRTVRKAYKNVYKKVKAQGERVLVRGNAEGVRVEMWVNTSTKTIETAYPKFFL